MQTCKEKLAAFGGGLNMATAWKKAKKLEGWLREMVPLHRANTAPNTTESLLAKLQLAAEMDEASLRATIRQIADEVHAEPPLSIRNAAPEQA